MGMRLSPELERRCLELAGVVRSRAQPIESRMSEEEFQALLMGEAKRQGWLAFHPHDSRKSAPGFPDSTLVHRDRRLLIFAELKVGDNEATPEQRDWLDALATVETVEAHLWRPENWQEIERLLKGERMAMG